MKRLILILLSSLGLVGISYADDAEAKALEIEALQQQLTETFAREDALKKELKELLYLLKSAYINMIAARVRTHWRYQGAKDDWGCTVYVLQDIDGKVEAVNIRKCNVDDSEKAQHFKNSIERAVYKASPLPSAPDDAVFDREILFEFVVN